MSWCLSKGRDFLPDVSVGFLRERLAVEREAKPRVRLLAALHRKQGWSLDGIASSLSLPRMTVYNVLRRFAGRGVDAAYDAKRGGRPCYLSLREQVDLRRRLLKGPEASGFHEGFWSTRMVLQQVEQHYGKRYTREHMTRVLCKLGFSSQTPRPANARKASLEEIQRFKKKRVAWYPTTSKEATSSFAKTKPPTA